MTNVFTYHHHKKFGIFFRLKTARSQQSACGRFNVENWTSQNVIKCCACMEEMFIQSRWCKQTKLHRKKNVCWSFFRLFCVCHRLSVPSVSCYFIQLYKCNVKITSNGMCAEQLLIWAWAPCCTSLHFDAKLHFLNDFIYFVLELLRNFIFIFLFCLLQGFGVVAMWCDEFLANTEYLQMNKHMNKFSFSTWNKFN